MKVHFGVPLGLATFLAILGFDADGATAKTSAKPGAANCAVFHLDVKADQPLHPVTLPPSGTCRFDTRNGFPVPDPACTPGAINPGLTLSVLQDKRFKTGCVRDKATKRHAKVLTYGWYGLRPPAHNSGQTQVCELDHFISLEIGGADTLDNIWPQCGPSRVELANRYFKQKDIVENYLAWLVKNNRMYLDEAQRGIADDWTQYLEKAKAACPGGRCKDANLPPPRF